MHETSDCFYSIITFSYTKYFVQSYTVDVFLTLSNYAYLCLHTYICVYIHLYVYTRVCNLHHVSIIYDIVSYTYSLFMFIPPDSSKVQDWFRRPITTLQSDEFATCKEKVTSVNLMDIWWRHNERDGVSNHQLPGCLLNCFFRHRSNKTSKLRVIGFCDGNSPVKFTHKGPVTWKIFPFDDVIITYCLLML